MRTHGPGRVLVGALLALVVVAGGNDDESDSTTQEIDLPVC